MADQQTSGTWHIEPAAARLRLARRALALVAVAFGLATIAAGTRVLLGADPGYVVAWPLLVFNTVMGFAYVAAGATAWRNPRRGAQAAAAIFGVNLLVLGAVASLYAAGGAVAIESVRAMLLRTGVWLVLLLGLAWVARRSKRTGDRAS